MPAKLLNNPNAIFIHIPKTGGKSILRYWANSHKAPTAKDTIPDDWPSYWAFAFVRHPIDRLISAYHMFNTGVAEYDTNGEIVQERVPILSEPHSLEQFCEKVLLGDDFNQRWSISRHTIPMTDPRNMLDRAKWIGRYERFEKDVEALKAHFNFTEDLPHVNSSKRSRDWREEWNELPSDMKESMTNYYEEDFKRLSYEKVL